MSLKDPQKRKEYQLQWREKNKDKRKKYVKEWALKNKICIKRRQHDWYLEHRTLSHRIKLSKQQKKENRQRAWQIWYSRNRDKKISDNKKWSKINHLKRNNTDLIYRNNRRKIDLNFKIRTSLRSRLRYAIKNHQKRGSAVSDLGCTVDFLIKHLESKFEKGMSWQNWSLNGWHIDHIKALHLFNLTTREQFLEAVNYKNLQPLWARDNLCKK